MLDDSSADCLCQVYVAGVGADLFTHSHSVKRVPKSQNNHMVAFDLNSIQTVARHLGAWRLVFLSRNSEDEYVFDRLQQFALPFVGKLSPDDCTPKALLEDFHACDLVYAPKFCAQFNWRHKFRSPSTSKGMVNILTFFSVSLVPFSQESYYQALQTYDNP